MSYFPDSKDLSLKEFLISYSEILKKSLEDIEADQLNEVFKALAKSVESGATIFTCGNGGSSSIAEHLVCDFIKGTSTDSKIDPKVFPLLTTPVITAIANDIDYEDIFSYQIQKYANKGDVLLSVSSSGNSPNIIKAIEISKKIGLITISFVGFDGGKAREISDFALHVNSNNYGICEDAHHSLMHIFAQYLRLQYIDDEDKLGNVKF
ncbi:MAG: SIS domain-containing protein [Gammaproteobacteria bacterium]|nr:SIS domain-containing protein [Gammaproteobacteria bacterium]